MSILKRNFPADAVVSLLQMLSQCEHLALTNDELQYALSGRQRRSPTLKWIFLGDLLINMHAKKNCMQNVQVSTTN